MPPKRKYNELDFSKRLALIKDSEGPEKLSQRQLSIKYKVSIGCVNNILKSRQKYKNSIENGNLSMKRMRKESPAEKINEITLQFIKTCNAKNISLSGPMIQDFARQVAEKAGLMDFKASNGWLDKFRNRHKITFNIICGEEQNVSEEVVTQWQQNLASTIEGFSADCIYNCDETALFYKALPTKSFMAPDSSRKGIKALKDRLTILFCCNSLGEKLTPLVIYKCGKPRCFKAINNDTKKLPVEYFFNKNAWMTGLIFNQWLQKINKNFRKQNKKVLLLMDNASCHTITTELTNITIKFLPPNTTDKLQPLDQGIIRAFKSRYRSLFIKHIINQIEKISTASEFAKSLNILTAINWISQVWQELPESVIRNCFHHTGIKITSLVEINFPETENEVQALINDLSAYELINEPVRESLFIECDGNELIEANDWQEELLNVAQSLNPEFTPPIIELMSDNDDVDGEAEINGAEEFPPSQAQVNEAINLLKKFAIMKCDTLIPVVSNVEKIIVEYNYSQRPKPKQKLITDFMPVA